ncbi:Autophagy-related protein 17 [Ophiocordyceps camponoti-floridani]|uniref:Autophagy-related protein 17 n=1 Tax=Ophiocordyceps camponoti-floridani TaxID=2030778 RepID=A0A8H4Q0K6_9HYPO|nr:Autophagy-related protein 17 [Ophiocordyceps camponoti-floridani]
MAASPGASSRRSAASSAASLRRSMDKQPPVVSADALVSHLLVAKRSLSSMALVLRANEIATAARTAHEDEVILAAHMHFLAGSMADQVEILTRVRRALHATYDWGKRDFKKLVRAMDEVDGKLATTMEMLRGTEVQDEMRPAGEEKRNLLDFVDETGVHAMREAMKQSIEELQGIQQSFDGDLLSFDADMRDLKRVTTMDTQPASEDEAKSSSELLLELEEHSATMAQLLASLTKHFDMCVTAMRTTEGAAAALARRRAAEVTQSQSGDGVSISGVMAEEPASSAGGSGHLEPETAEERAEMVRVVTQDAHEVDDVVREIQQRLAEMERSSASLNDQRRRTVEKHARCRSAFWAVSDVGSRLGDYVAAESDFRARWEAEKDVVSDRLREMGSMRDFYEGYGSAYASLLLELERRRSVERQVEAVWRKASEGIERLLEADRAARDAFRAEVGDFLPAEWAGVGPAVRRWRVVPEEG